MIGVRTVHSVREMEQAVLRADILAICFTRRNDAPSETALRRMERLGLKYPEIAWFHIDLDLLPAAASRYLVFNVPAILVYFRGKPAVKHQGYIDVPRLTQALEDMLSDAAAPPVDD